jgi:hypothetical protein
MTWEQLEKKIARMPADQKGRDVLLIEDYDGPNRRAAVLAAVQAHEDVYCGFGIGCDRILLEGDLYFKEQKRG